MEYQMGSTMKLCATCEYWIGTRQPNFYATHVVLPTQSVEGKCFCMGGPHFRANRLSNSTTCFKYEKWKMLK